MVKKVLALILCLVYFFCSIGLYVFISSRDGTREENTRQFSATVDYAAVKEGHEDVRVEIYVKEYSASLYIDPNVSNNVNVEDFRSLKAGDKISFRIENYNDYDELNNGVFVPIVSLKTLEKDIFTLNDYNTYVSTEMKNAKIASLIMMLVFLGLSVWCAVRLKKAIVAVKAQKNDTSV